MLVPFCSVAGPDLHLWVGSGCRILVGAEPDPGIG
jgi:hypothetical protein